jgi:hypothetical protein
VRVLTSVSAHAIKVCPEREFLKRGDAWRYVLLETMTFNHEVMGSNPIALTNEINSLAEKHQTKHPA